MAKDNKNNIKEINPIQSDSLTQLGDRIKTESPKQKTPNLNGSQKQLPITSQIDLAHLDLNDLFITIIKDNLITMIKILIIDLVKLNPKITIK